MSAGMVTIVNDDFLIMTLSGVIDTLALRKLAQDMNEIDAGRFYRKRLVYFKDVTEISLKYEDVMYYRSIRPEPQIVTHTALCAFSDFQYGIARMFQSVMETDKRVMQIFSDRESAAQWLGVDSGLLQGHSD
jgi:hypothetical protein